ncbi:hypothetical protein ACFYT4_34645 [Streptomyces sp. NPDC004609]|uniref:hypothetical protein n=1 Tax=Streptomyces sp. NPDC004609 TaxID=3364704 RepID=UPI00368E0FA0
MLKQTLGWTRPKVRAPHSADLCTWEISAAHTQLRLARPQAEAEEAGAADGSCCQSV